MAEVRSDGGSLAERLRRAYRDKSLDQLAPLLADDVRWGDDDNPRRCRSRADVLATFSGAMADGVGGRITEVATGSEGVLCGLAVRWPDGDDRPDRSLFHVYVVRDGLISEIRPYDDRASAAEAAGL